MNIVLFGTGSCHLCNQAEALLHSARVTVKHVDIAEDDALLARYGARIPVVQRVNSGVELDWPFDESALGEFLAQSNI